MKSEVFMIMGGLAIFAIVLSLFIQMQGNQSTPKNSDTNGISILGEGDNNGTKTPTPTIAEAPPMTIDDNIDYKAVLTTSEGEITIDLAESDVPKTVNNFVYLARTGFYDGTTFHRVINEFMIQGGDPKGDGTGGPGYKFDDESFDGDYERGTVAMANSGPNTNGSQFFIMHKTESSLPKNYVIFGKVTKGLTVVDTIATADVTMSASGENSKPKKPVIVNSIKIVETDKIQPTATTEPTAEPTTEETPTPTDDL